MKWFIYVLRDPRTNEVRYVGKTVNPVGRLNGHVSTACMKSVPPHHCARWIRVLVSLGLRPIMEVIDAGRGGGHGAAEQAWIIEWRLRGAQLTNIAEGGRGAPAPRSPETIAKMRESMLGRLQSPETIAKRVLKLRKPCTPERREACRIAMQGRTTSPQTRKAARAANLGRKRTTEAISATSAKNKGRTRTPEQCARISAGKLGKSQSEATKTKIAATLRGRKLTPEHRANARAGWLRARQEKKESDGEA